MILRLDLELFIFGTFNTNYPNCSDILYYPFVVVYIMCYGRVRMVTHKHTKRDAAISTRIPCTLKKLIHRFVILDAHLNESDFIRDAIREKIQQDAPELYRQLFAEVSASE